MRTGKGMLILMSCLFLVGCQNEVESEEQQTEASDNVVMMESEETEHTEDTEKNIVSEEDVTIISEIMSGNLEHLEEEDQSYRSIIEKYARGEDLYPAGWRQIDLNGDGFDDLILQVKNSESQSGEKRIIGIIACYEDRAECIMMDLNDHTAYSFCGPSGELMYTSFSYGGPVDIELYSHYYYDSEWNKTIEYTLYAYRVNGSDSEPVGEWWEERHPDMVENGRYYRKYDGDGNDTQFVNLTFDEFKGLYETETGYEFYSSYFPE